MRKVDIMSRALNASQALGPHLPLILSKPAEERLSMLKSVAGMFNVDAALVLSELRWTEEGFPSVTMKHTLAEDLLNTCPPDASEVRTPWGVFLIEVPNGLVRLGDLDVSFMLVSRLGSSFLRQVHFSNTSYSVVRLSELFRNVDDPLGTGGPATPPGLDCQDEVNRAFEMLDTLLANVCFAATTPGRSGPGGTLHRKNTTRQQKTTAGPPVGIQYELGRPVLLKLDDRSDEEKRAMRSVVRNYVKTGRREFNGSYCRRGHWHNGLAPGVTRTRDENGRWHFGLARERRFRPPTMVNRGSGVVLVREHVLTSE